MRDRIEIKESVGIDYEEYFHVKIDVEGLSLGEIESEAARWEQIVEDRSLASAEDYAAMQEVADAKVSGVDDRNDYLGAAQAISTAWYIAAYSAIHS